MRISKIKLAGFKSFVDPTVLSLPGNLTGIVGPNGCGKSNVIDALQWVLGESSAKHLRGDSMADVIFNGSSARKPVGQAAVEIVFDNAGGTLGGPYASYAEIAIKRQVSRDGVSAFYLNGTRCRRRDITDLFLGTGVGYRSYSVIAQGTISRIIEAKPEELRLFLEEAAGISKYKERRRETEARIGRASENLARLNDIRDELGKQLDRLQQQAKAAERFQALKQEERRLKAELLALASRRLQQEAEAQERVTRQHETAVESAVAGLRAVEADIEKGREAQARAVEHFNEVQASYYRVGAEISRLEQAIQHQRERRAAAERDLAQAQQDLKAAEAHVASSEVEVLHLAGEIETLEPEHRQGLEEEQRLYERLDQCEQAVQAWQGEWDEFNQRASESLRDEKGELARRHHLEVSLGNIHRRIGALHSEEESLGPESLEQAADGLRGGLAAAGALQDDLQGQRAETQARLRQTRSELEAASRELDDCRAEGQALRERLASLEALQQAARGVDEGPVRDWLEAQGLTEARRMIQDLSVERGWERALESALGVLLQGVVVDDFDGRARALQPPDQGPLALIDSAQAPGAQVSLQAGIGTLIEKASSPWPLEGLLGGIYAVDTLEEALVLRPRLSPYESMVTRAGERLGPNWLRLSGDQDVGVGAIQREREIGDLSDKHRTLEQIIAGRLARLAEARDTLQALEGADEALQAGLSGVQEQLAGLGAELAAKQTELQQARLRKERIEAELGELQERQRYESAELQSARERLGAIQDLGHALEAQRTDLAEHRDRLRLDLQAAREQWRMAREQSHMLALRLEAMRSQIRAIEQTLAHHRELAEQSFVRCRELQRAVAEGSSPLERLQGELGPALGRRLAVEAELAGARGALQSLDTTLREGDQERTEREHSLETLREGLEQARMEGQALRVRMQGYEEQLQGSGFQLEELLGALPAEVETAVWEERLASLERRIQRLGPINLAAMDEVAQLQERKTYLDRQHADLTEALGTLQNAIRQIDKETRARFTETFDKLNAGLQTMFPTLFGGGHAYLELTGEDLLETGVTIMARPPGKRNSTIHLLSGGEKALSALALVFSIFELNPAPFCLLDEVDAPLDDVNVVRLCDMLGAMARRVQFLFITHNKLTMEIAERLIGVTMAEPGVSRLVAVDIDEAVQLAATG